MNVGDGRPHSRIWVTAEDEVAAGTAHAPAKCGRKRSGVPTPASG